MSNIIKGVILIGMTLGFTGATAVGWAGSSSGMGLSDKLSSSVSVRAGSVRHGRLHRSGGLHSGK